MVSKESDQAFIYTAVFGVPQADVHSFHGYGRNDTATQQAALQLVLRAHPDAIKALELAGCAGVGDEEGIAGTRHVIRKYVGKRR